MSQKPSGPWRILKHGRPICDYFMLSWFGGCQWDSEKHARAELERLEAAGVQGVTIERGGCPRGAGVGPGEC